MMTIEDNSDLRAAMNYAHNALKRVMHVFIITQDAPKQKSSNGHTEEEDGTKIGHYINDDSFSLALKEINKNQDKSNEYDDFFDKELEDELREIKEMSEASSSQKQRTEIMHWPPAETGTGRDMDVSKSRLKRKKSLAFKGI